MNTAHDYRLIRFVKEVKREVGAPTTADAIRKIRKVFAQLRLCLTTNQLSMLVRRIPTGLDLLLFANWKLAEQQAEIHHLDELVERVYRVDHIEPHHAFRTEIIAMETILVILSKLEQVVGPAALPQSMMQEVHRVPLGIAA